jgi:phosphohistidine phosphatase
LKTIILVRHAKSSWDNILQKDFDRTLNARGLQDAPMMGKRMLQRNIEVDLIITSAAMRAKQTATAIAVNMNYATQNILELQELYHASSSIITEVISSNADKNNTVMIVCHNPGITNWANQQMHPFLENMPTCSMIAFSINENHWQLFETAKKELLFFDFPKNGL